MKYEVSEIIIFIFTYEDVTMVILSRIRHKLIMMEI